MKTNTFVTRTAAATAHNSTIRAAHKAKNRKERPLQLAVSADSRQQEVYSADRNTRMRGATFLRETRAGDPLLVYYKSMAPGPLFILPGGSPVTRSFFSEHLNK